MLMVRLIRAEDIPVEEQSLSTYVDVHLLPLNRQSQTFEPNDTTINVSFRCVPAVVCGKASYGQSEKKRETFCFHFLVFLVKRDSSQASVYKREFKVLSISQY